jgi:O-antigen/teichoic acid export membrane protein
MSEDERRAGIRESFVFFMGAGSSMVMQYLPVIIAGRLGATTTAAVLFGAVQATTPLLLFSRVYGAVMMPAFAGDADDAQSRAHLRLVQPFFLPSLAVALGVAPWVVASLGLAPRGDALSVGALVALMTLMQVWATPAVTILSARKRELVPALASLGGLVVAMLIWVVGVRTGEVLLLPMGLAVGAVMRSLVPMWVISGHRLGQLDASRVVTLLSGIGVALVLVALGRASTGVALAGGAVLVVTGFVMAYGTWRRGVVVSDENPSR